MRVQPQMTGALTIRSFWLVYDGKMARMTCLELCRLGGVSCRLKQEACMTFGRRLLLAIAALAVVATTFAPTEASARWRGGYGHRGWGWGGAAVGLGLGLGLAAGYPYYARGGYYGYGPYYSSGYYGGCWRRVLVDTPWGPRPRRVWVCG